MLNKNYGNFFKNKEVFLVRKILATFLSALLLALLVIPTSVNANNREVNDDQFLKFIEDFLDRRTSVLTSEMDTLLQLQSNDRLIQESTDVFTNEKTAIAELKDRRDVLEKWGEAYTHHTTEVKIKSKEIINEKIIIDVEEYTELYYKKLMGDEPEYTAWVSDRQFVFKQSPSGEWYLISQELVNPYGPAPINESVGVMKEEINNGSKDHTMIITKKTSTEIYLTYHTTDTLNRSFASLSTSYPKALWIPHLIKATF